MTYDAVLVLECGSYHFGRSVGVPGMVFGELCFTTAMTGYQEVVTDPSFAGQVVLFTSPHVGNVGTNPEDNESTQVMLRGVVLREEPTSPHNFRSECSLSDFFLSNGVVAIAGVDTRAVTLRLRNEGLCNCAVVTSISADQVDVEAIVRQIRNRPSDDDLVRSVEVPTNGAGGHRIALVDYGVKLNIIRSLEAMGFSVTVFPCDATHDEVLGISPHGIVLSNGPGDPKYVYCRHGHNIDRMVRSGLPVLGICLGHQLIGLSFGCQTVKMSNGHRGINHPVKCIESGKVLIVTQNHGFTVEVNDQFVVTHVSLFDGTLAGMASRDFPVFSVQYHPEASPGPHDCCHLFDKFFGMIRDIGF